MASTWWISVPSVTVPIDIETDNPTHTGEYRSLPPQYQLYSLPEAMHYVGYRVTVGDTVVIKNA